MAVFVLVHGAYIGGWAWDRLVPLLEDYGHTAHAPDLIGAGRRVAELGQHVAAAGHADQLADVLESEDLHDVVLVGHGYGGNVIRCSRSDRTAWHSSSTWTQQSPRHGRPPAADFPPALFADMTTKPKSPGRRVAARPGREIPPMGWHRRAGGRRLDGSPPGAVLNALLHGTGHAAYGRRDATASGLHCLHSVGWRRDDGLAEQTSPPGGLASSAALDRALSDGHHAPAIRPCCSTH